MRNPLQDFVHFVANDEPAADGGAAIWSVQHDFYGLLYASNKFNLHVSLAM